ncbi:DUF389 domain-containing protein [Companilactobacillus futsaii]|uniref:DUF389 domain-containing protein n=2 Tax=Companilactobacillus futsaii TaxID=938155 RepID=A0A5B7SZC3_9LACO|nr:DUF389 domain-containing protein [Companilactobacillus futsaii]KRK99561.1 hypothetical protein FC88_GL000011 [Companilactobacillus futsaii JCM 17355]QCX23720.1 DUF389 domain-containing protein [Companilactobacillus futsaii]
MDMDGEDQLLKSDIIDKHVRQNLNLSWLNFAVLFCATIIASIGLNMDSVAIVIGAMLISPIMDPIIGMGYGVGIRDTKLLRKAVMVYLIEVIVGLIAATIYFSLSPIKDASEQIIARTQPAIWDVLVAFFGGVAGIIGSAKKDPGNILPGVAIATALIPPLSTVGYGLSQFKWSIVFSAGYLFLINTFFIALATMLGTLVFNLKQHRASGIPIKNQVLIIIAAIIITIPSLISASTLVKKTYNETQLTSFIDNEIPGLYVVNKQFEDKKIKLVVIGDDLNKSEISSLDNRLSDYQLGDYKLQFQQLSKGNYLSVNAFKKYVDQEKSSTTQSTTSSSDKNLLKLKSQITKEYPDAVEKVYIGQLVEKNKSDKALILVKLKDETPDNQTDVKKFVKTSADKLNIDYSLHFTKD